MADGPSKTFFSYAREDSVFVLRLVKDLRAAGAAVWLDQLDIQAGLHWDTEIEKALRECPRHVIVLSPAAVNSPNVMDEVSFALEERKQVIPLLYRECQVPFRLRRVQYIDFREDYAAGVQGLLRDLSGLQAAVPQAAESRVRVPAETAPVEVRCDSSPQLAEATPIADVAHIAQAHYERGKDYYEKRQCTKAIDAFTQAVRLKPDYALAYNDRGRAYDILGQYDRAIQDYDRALKITPNYAEAYRNRGVAYSHKGQDDRAFRDYEQALLINPNYAYAYNSRGWAYYNKGQYDPAIQDYNQALEIDPGFATAYYNRGLAYYKKGQYDPAIQDYDQAVEINPNDAESYINRGLACEAKGDQSPPIEKRQYYKEAIQDFERALQADSNVANAEKHRNRAAAKLANLNG